VEGWDSGGRHRDSGGGLGLGWRYGVARVRRNRGSARRRAPSARRSTRPAAPQRRQRRAQEQRHSICSAGAPQPSPQPSPALVRPSAPQDPTTSVHATLDRRPQRQAARPPAVRDLRRLAQLSARSVPPRSRIAPPASTTTATAKAARAPSNTIRDFGQEPTVAADRGSPPTDALPDAKATRTWEARWKCVQLGRQPANIGYMLSIARRASSADISAWASSTRIVSISGADASLVSVPTSMST
jgi:hypothetical protein